MIYFEAKAEKKKKVNLNELTRFDWSKSGSFCRRMAWLEK